MKLLKANKARKARKPRSDRGKKRSRYRGKLITAGVVGTLGVGAGAYVLSRRAKGKVPTGSGAPTRVDPKPIRKPGQLNGRSQGLLPGGDRRALPGRNPNQLTGRSQKQLMGRKQAERITGQPDRLALPPSKRRAKKEIMNVIKDSSPPTKKMSRRTALVGGTSGAIVEAGALARDKGRAIQQIARDPLKPVKTAAGDLANLQVKGKKKMSRRAFLRGAAINTGVKAGMNRETTKKVAGSLGERLGRSLGAVVDPKGAAIDQYNKGRRTNALLRAVRKGLSDMGIFKRRFRTRNFYLSPEV